jgi:tryptophanyl-tRNA synthetase
LLTIKAPAKRVMSLSKPDKKMSKSDPNQKSKISIIDSAEDVAKKIKSAITDSEDGITFDPVRRPELANLINLIVYLSPDPTATPEDLIKDCTSKKVLKDHLTATINSHLAPIRDRYAELMDEKNRKTLDDVAVDGAERAAESANATMKEVKGVLGLT